MFKIVKENFWLGNITKGRINKHKYVNKKRTYVILLHDIS